MSLNSLVQMNVSGQITPAAYSGKSTHINTIISKAENIPFTETDIRSLVGNNVNILSYEELMSKKSIHDALAPHGTLILLYQFQGTNVGHWVACWMHGMRIYHYDSYGFSPDYESGQLHYTKLLHESGFEVLVNPHAHQYIKEHTNTCGRHVCMRLLFGSYDHDKYNAMVREAVKLDTPDDIVTAMTITHGLNRLK